MSELDIRRKTNGRKISAMWDYFGILQGKHCADCCHLQCEIINQRNYWKCRIYGVSSSVATDWVKGWTACRAWNVIAINKRDLYKQLRHSPKEKKGEPIDGQIELKTD